MKKLLLLLLFFVTLNAYAFEFEYKSVFLDIPDSEILGAGIANLPNPEDAVFLRGESWNMGISDIQFEKDCATYSEKLKGINCSKQTRLEMLDVLYQKKNLLAQMIFDLPKEGGNIKRQVFEGYVLYSSAGLDKFSVALLVDIQNGRTFAIQGKFSDKHLKWLRLKP